MGTANAAFLTSSFSSTVNPYPLKLSTILDSGTTLHIFNDLSKFKNMRKAIGDETITAGSSDVRIIGFGTIDLQVTKPNGSPGRLRLRNAAYCTEFNTNLVSFKLLRENGIYWDTIKNQLIRKDGTILCQIQLLYGQFVLQYEPITKQNRHMAFNTQLRRHTSRDPRPDAVGDGVLWHARMGHPGPLALQKLGANSLGVRLRGPKTTECQHCAQAKIHRQISRRRPDREKDIPCHEIYIDWTELEEDHDGFIRIMFITDAWTGMVFCQRG